MNAPNDPKGSFSIQPDTLALKEKASAGPWAWKHAEAEKLT